MSSTNDSSKEVKELPKLVLKKVQTRPKEKVEAKISAIELARQLKQQRK